MRFLTEKRKDKRNMSNSNEGILETKENEFQKWQKKNEKIADAVKTIINSFEQVFQNSDLTQTQINSILTTIKKEFKLKRAEFNNAMLAVKEFWVNANNVKNCKLAIV